MKGVIELNWKIILVLIGGIIAFIVIFLFTTGFSEKLKELFANFTLSDLIDFWKKIRP